MTGGWWVYGIVVATLWWLLSRSHLNDWTEFLPGFYRNLLRYDQLQLDHNSNPTTIHSHADARSASCRGLPSGAKKWPFGKGPSVAEKESPRIVDFLDFWYMSSVFRSTAEFGFSCFTGVNDGLKSSRAFLHPTAQPGVQDATGMMPRDAEADAATMELLCFFHPLGSGNIFLKYSQMTKIYKHDDMMTWWSFSGNHGEKHVNRLRVDRIKSSPRRRKAPLRRPPDEPCVTFSWCHHQKWAVYKLNHPPTGSFMIGLAAYFHWKLEGQLVNFLGCLN